MKSDMCIFNYIHSQINIIFSPMCITNICMDVLITIYLLKGTCSKSETRLNPGIGFLSVKYWPSAVTLPLSGGFNYSLNILINVASLVRNQNERCFFALYWVYHDWWRGWERKYLWHHILGTTTPPHVPGNHLRATLTWFTSGIASGSL
jgi:hypothetical protein